MYRVLPKEEAKQEILREQRFNSESKRVLNKMTKFGMAQKRNRMNVNFELRIARGNAESYLAHNMQLMNETKTFYAWTRQKIQDPATPRSQKLAYRKMEQILIERFRLDYLQLNNPLMNKDGGNKSAFSFCYTKPRVP